ncbi:hypothetical protein Pelo_19821 [Pelomyxa schiedti]|nr:hypothetical protein Pelo_19821 [Pelomyxa schiedti]
MVLDTYSSFISYCSVDKAEANLAFYIGTECPSSPESIYSYYDIVSPTGTPSTECNSAWYSFGDTFTTGYYQLSSCGAFNDLIKYNMEVIIDSDDCSGVPLWGSATLTRFCEYPEDDLP